MFNCLQILLQGELKLAVQLERERYASTALCLTEYSTPHEKYNQNWKTELRENG